MRWKVYFVFYIVISVVFFYWNYNEVRFPSLGDLISFASSIIGGVALYGYIWNKGIFSPRFWKVFLMFFLTTLIIDALYAHTQISQFLPIPSFLESTGRVNDTNTKFAVIDTFAGWVVVLPELYALYQLGKNKFYKK